ncbi:MAG TPA: c-type cytochrome [Methylobacter sp.]
MTRCLLVLGLGALALNQSGCSLIERQPAAATSVQTAETVFHTCDGCHGPDNIRVDFMSPKIIGQKKAYLVGVLRNFRDLKRHNPYMNGVVSRLTDQDIDNLAAYYTNYKDQDKH